jgi:hypothetical protein
MEVILNCGAKLLVLNTPSARFAAEPMPDDCKQLVISHLPGLGNALNQHSQAPANQ